MVWLQIWDLEREKTSKMQIHSSTNYLSCTKFSVYFCLSFLEDMFLKVQLKDQHVLQDSFQVTCLKVYNSSRSHKQSVSIVHFTTPSPASNVHVFFKKLLTILETKRFYFQYFLHFIVIPAAS